MSPVIRYCEGRPERPSRALGPDERARVASFRRSLWARTVLRVLLVPAAMAAAWGAALAARAVLPDGAGREVPALVALALLVVAVPVALLRAADGVRGVRAVRRDLAGGVALEFGDGDARLAILPESERVLAIGGLPADLGERAHVGEAAPPAPELPTYAMDAAALERPAFQNGLVRRALTPAERAELTAHVARLVRPPWFFVAAALGGALLGVRLAASPDAPAPVRALAVVALLAGAFVSARRYWRLRHLAQTLRDDADDGWVIRLTAGEMAGDELLLRSGVPWTVEGGPADWRLARSAR
jgi:hypothetical protein